MKYFNNLLKGAYEQQSQIAVIGLKFVYTNYLHTNPVQFIRISRAPWSFDEEGGGGEGAGAKVNWPLEKPARQLPSDTAAADVTWNEPSDSTGQMLYLWVAANRCSITNDWSNYEKINDFGFVPLKKI